jgi:DNA polymerase/3'-5' exonuclease PolX
LVSDIEIVAIPLPYKVGLFEEGIASVVNKWEKIRGVLPCEYTRRILPEGIELDLFLVNKENWGYQFMLRTGSGDFNQRVLLTSLKSRGYECDGGYVWLDGEKCETGEEKDLFRMMGIPYIEPEKREV